VERFPENISGGGLVSNGTNYRLTVPHVTTILYAGVWLGYVSLLHVALHLTHDARAKNAKEADAKRNRARQQTLITFNVMLILAKTASNAIQQYMGYTIKKEMQLPTITRCGVKRSMGKRSK
jgi:hypothetical protein